MIKTFYCKGCQRDRPIEDKIYLHNSKIPKCRSCVISMIENKSSSLHKVKNSLK